MWTGRGLLRHSKSSDMKQPGNPALTFVSLRYGTEKTTKSFRSTRPIKTGTLASILKRIAVRHGITVDDLLGLLGL
jgi:hypothetical protein